MLENGELKDTVFAQIGQSSYLPKHYKFKRFLSEDEFAEYQCKADLIISHGGTGALISALKLGKQVIAVPRLKKFGEHIDDHQIQVASLLADEGYLCCVLDVEKLLDCIKFFSSSPKMKHFNKESKIMQIIKGFIENSS